MLDINQYFFWQLANFFILFIALYYILFKPFLRLFKERENSTKGSLDSARAMDGEKDDIIARIDEKLTDARGQAKTVFEKFSNEGLDNQKQTLDSAQNEAVEINRKAKADLDTAVDKARSSLKSNIETFAKQIVEKLVKA
jgi:F-type H+-transporting ATPase subunit b